MFNSVSKFWISSFRLVIDSSCNWHSCSRVVEIFRCTSTHRRAQGGCRVCHGIPCGFAELAYFYFLLFSWEFINVFIHRNQFSNFLQFRLRILLFFFLSSTFPLIIEAQNKFNIISFSLYEKHFWAKTVCNFIINC